MRKHGNIDTVLLGVVLCLSIFGLIMISSASVVLSYNKFDYNYYYVLHQIIYGFLPGIILLFLFQKINYRFFKNYGSIFLVATIALLVVVFIPSFSQEIRETSRWVKIGFISFQPSEIAKLAFILYFAAWLEEKGKNVKDFSASLMPFSITIVLIAIPLILQPDIGTLAVMVLTAFSMYFLAGAKLTYIFSLILSGIATLFILINIAPYRMERLIVFLHPETDPQGIGYQINQAILALGSGGIFGVGFGRSIQKFNYLPEPFGDSIFAIIGEELGIIGLTFVIVLFIIFAFRGFRIAMKASDDFGKFVAAGITSWIVFQSLMNMSAMTSLIPLTGITLPFISYGGSSLAVSLAAVGILLSVSKYGKQ